MSRQRFQFSWRPPRTLPLLLGVFGVFGLVIGGCGGGYQEPPLPILHLPGVQQIPGVDALHTRSSEIVSVATYAVTPTAPARVLVVVGDQLYDVGVDGSDLHEIPMACYYVAATPDGRLVTCENDQGIVLKRLDDADAPIQVVSDLGLHPALLGDDATLVTTLPGQGQCVLALWAVTASPAGAAPRLRVRLALPTTGGGCGIVRGLAWTPDGAWLAFVDIHNATQEVYALKLSELLPQVPPPPTLPALPQTIQVARDQLISLGSAGSGTATSWSRAWGVGSAGETWTLTFANEKNELVRVDPVTKQQTTLLGVPYAPVSAVAWTPDGQHLVFAQRADHCGDCAPPVPESRLYVYVHPPTLPATPAP